MKKAFPRVCSRFQPLPFAACVVVAALCLTNAHAQLTWGIGGAGGAGTWNLTNANWWNGSSNVVWNGGTATFAGVGGTVTPMFPGPTATGIVFNVAGYSFHSSGWINGSTTGLTITTNSNATIGATLNHNVSAPTLTKNGAGMLTVTGTNFFPALQVDAGEYRVGGFSSLFFSDVTMASAPGVMVTLAQTPNSVSVRSLFGGGIVQPDTVNRTVVMTLFGSGSFGGILRDNGSGKLAVTLGGFNALAELTGTNTYTGATTVNVGTLSLAGNGSALNTGSVRVGTSGILRLDNSSAVANRISDALAIAIEGGKLELLGNASTAVDEQFGVLTYTGAAKLNATQSLSTSALMTFASAARASRGTVDVTGSGRTTWGGIALTSGALIAPFVTAGDEWATLGGDGRVSPLAVYSTDLNTASVGDDVKITGGGISPLVASAVRNSLNLQNSSGGIGTVLIPLGQSLTLTSGGLLTSGTGAHQIQGGTIASGGNEFVVTARNGLTISSAIGETIAATGLTKNGAGVLSLSATNSYSGNTAIVEGTLAVSSDGNLGTGTAVEINGGTLKAAGGFSSAKQLRNTIGQAGVIDTNGNSVSFSGGATGGFSKTGAGTLTLTNGAAGSFFLQQGTLALPNAASGIVTLQGGNLMAAGTLGSVSLISNSTLDIGGAGAATLASGLALSGGSGSQLTISFGVGSGASDHWTVTGTFPPISGPPSPVFLFDFRDLGGVTTVADYVLIGKNAGGPPPPVSAFAFAPSSISAGWAGTFSVTPTAVSVRFSAVPEPGSALLLMLGGAVAGSVRRRRSGQPRE